MCDWPKLPGKKKKAKNMRLTNFSRIRNFVAGAIFSFGVSRNNPGCPKMKQTADNTWYFKLLGDHDIEFRFLCVYICVFTNYTFGIHKKLA